jgi:hypothetical protein
MKTGILTLIIFLVFNLAWGQTNPIVKNLFYNLPLDSSCQDIRKTIKTDKRFIPRNNDTSQFANPYTYFGITSDKGVMQLRPDSIEIGLTVGFTRVVDRRGKAKSVSITFLRLQYFYSSKDSVQKEYERVLYMLRPIHKNAIYQGIDTINYNSELQEQTNAEGMTYSNPKSHYSIEVLKTALAKNQFGLFLEFRRKDAPKRRLLWTRRKRSMYAEIF